MIRAVAFYLLESTAFAAAVSLLALCLQKRSAASRHTILLIAAAKFAAPAALFAFLGTGIREVLPAIPSLALFAQPIPAAIFAPAATPANARNSDTILLIIGLLWLVGVLIAIARWLRRILQPSLPVTEALPSQNAVLASAQQRIGYPRTVRLRLSASQSEPALSGFLRPVITVPQSLFSVLAKDELESVFLHELAHAKRRDNLISVFVHALVCCLWFHPLVRWLERRMLDERELACDEAVMACGVPPKTYMAGILKVCGFPFSRAVAGISGVTSSHVQKRMEAIMSWSFESSFRPAPRWLLAVLIAAVTIVPLSLGILTATLRGQAKLNPTSPENIQRSSITCAFADTRYPEGTVIQQGSGPEQMCVGVLAPLDPTKPQTPTRIPQWVRTNADIRQRSASVVHLAETPQPPPFSCKPKPSHSQSSCSCEGADLGFSLGSLVDSANGALKCDKGNWQPATRESNSTKQ